jgi:hypothetical protein
MEREKLIVVLESHQLMLSKLKLDNQFGVWIDPSFI